MASYTDITRSEPYKIIEALGYTPHEDEKGKWTTGEKDGSIAVFRGKSGDYMYRSWSRDERGNVLHLIRARTGLTFPAAVQYAREILSGTAPSIPPNFPASKPTPAISSSTQTRAQPSDEDRKILNLDEVESRYKSGSDDWSSGDRIPDILRDRGITVLDAKFSGTFRASRNDGSIRIPYFGMCEKSGAGMVGMETRRPDGKKYYMRDTRAGIWYSHPASLEIAREIVVVESMIDAMSHDLLSKQCSERGYIAIRSGSEKYAVAMIKSLVEAGSPIEKVSISSDNDAAGMLYAHKIMLDIGNVEGLEVRYTPPIGGKNDHNDALRAALRGSSARAERIREAIEDRRRESLDTFTPDMAAE